MTEKYTVVTTQLGRKQTQSCMITQYRYIRVCFVSRSWTIVDSIHLKADTDVKQNQGFAFLFPKSLCDDKTLQLPRMGVLVM